MKTGTASTPTLRARLGRALEYLDAAAAISAWPMQGPRAWPLDEYARQVLFGAAARPQSEPQASGVCEETAGHDCRPVMACCAT